MKFKNVAWASAVFIFASFSFVMLSSSLGMNLDPNSQFKCTSLSSVSERMNCSLALSDEEASKVLPVGCMWYTSQKRGACVDDYGKYLKCRSISNDASREKCFLEQLDYSGNFDAESAKCAGSFYSLKGSCYATLKDKVLLLSKFRMNDMQQKAWNLKAKGISEPLVLEFAANVEEKKRDFNFAQDDDARVEAAEGVYSLWNDFKTRAYAEKLKQ